MVSDPPRSHNSISLIKVNGSLRRAVVINARSGRENCRAKNIGIKEDDCVVVEK